MARSKKQRQDEETQIIKPCRYREGQYICTRSALYDVFGENTLVFVHHIGEPGDIMDRITGQRKPAHYMVPTLRLHDPRIIGEAR